MKKIFIITLILAFLITLSSCATVTPLGKAAKAGDIKKVGKLLNEGADVNEEMTPGLSPLHEAVFNNAPLDIIRLLLDKGADVNKRSAGDGWSNLRRCSGVPLHIAAYNGNAKMVKLLLDYGADVTVSHYRLHKTPLRIAEEKGYSVIARMLREAEEKAYKNLYAKESSQESEKILRRETAKPAIVGSDVEDAKKSQNKDIKTASAVQSDIDKPFFSTESKIMNDNDYAIIIGIEGYSSLPKSDYSYDDAKLVKDYLKALGVKERNIEFLTDEKATLSGIMKSIEAWLPNKLKKGGKVFVYYSGHGSPDPVTGEAFLVPYDGDPNYLDVTGYPLKRLYEKLGRLHAFEVIIVLDSCFSGAGGRSVLAKGARPLVMTSRSAVMPQNMVVLSATQGSQISTSSQEKGHGIFTYYFLKALKDGKKSVSEIYEHIKPYVEDDAKSINVQQSPSINPDVESLKGRFLLKK